jgi:colicin import membrane protein
MAIPVAIAIARMGITKAIKKYGKKAVEAAKKAKTSAPAGAKAAASKTKAVGRGAIARAKAAERRVSGAVGSKKPIEAAKAARKPTDKRVAGVRGKSKSATTRKANANRAANEKAATAASNANVRSGRRRIGAAASVASVAPMVATAVGKTGTTKKAAAASKRSKFGAGSSKTIMHKGKKLANVDASQLKATGMTLRGYMNAWNKSGKRPTKKKK